MNGYFVERENMELEHHGILGMKWGVRRYQSYETVPRGSGKGGKEIGAARSAKGNALRTLGKVYSLNEKVYNKFGNKTLASMNADAKNRMNSAAKAADKQASEKRINKLNEYKEKRLNKLNKKVSNLEKEKGRYDDAIKDLEERGSKSYTFEKARNKELSSMKRDDVMRDATDIINYGIFSSVKVKQLLDENSRNSKRYGEAIERGKKALNQFSSYKVSELTSKRDIRRASRFRP